MGSRTTIFVMFLFILPTLIISDTSPIQRVSAASNCDNGDFVTPEWNTTVERLAKVPNIYTPDFENERKGKRDRDRDDVADAVTNSWSEEPEGIGPAVTIRVVEVPRDIPSN